MHWVDCQSMYRQQSPYILPPQSQGRAALLAKLPGSRVLLLMFGAYASVHCRLSSAGGCGTNSMLQLQGCTTSDPAACTTRPSWPRAIGAAASLVGMQSGVAAFHAPALRETGSVAAAAANQQAQ